MGANPYCYFAPYQEDIAQALSALQRTEFEAGRYNPALGAASPPTYTFLQSFPPTASFPSPGAQHRSIKEARIAGRESGTGSILDILGLSPTPEFLHASPSTHGTLVNLFGHSTPSHADVERSLLGASGDQLLKAAQFWEDIQRGEVRYFLVYEQGTPSEIFFAGYSVD